MFASTLPQYILLSVNANWHELSNDTYDDTYHTATPPLHLVSANCQSQPVARNRKPLDQRQEQTDKPNNETTDKRRHARITSQYPFLKRHY
jgi:hypothetical protein